MIKVLPHNETYVRIDCNDFGIEQELSEYFSFMVPSAKFSPKFKAGIWDGIIRLFSTRNKTIYKGLVEEIIKFAASRGHELVVDSSLKNNLTLKLDQVKAFVDELDLHGKGNKITVRDYQYDAVYHALNHERCLLLSPTSSGKSLIMYSIIRWYIEQDRKILIVVPSTMLVEQLFSDFQDYSSANGFDVNEHFSTLYSGKERVFTKHCVISTWQTITSMMKTDKTNFDNLVRHSEVALFDEAHSYAANVVLMTLEKFLLTKYRIGTTGTISDAKINTMSLVGLMGPVYKVTTTKELMDAGQIVKLDIKCVVLEYPEHTRKAFKGMKYDEEIDFLVANDSRNKFISKLAASVKGNALILLNYVERHGKVIYEMLPEYTDKKVFYIHGGVDTDDREEIRKLLDSETNVVVVASSSIMSTGVNIPSIEHIIFAIPSKSTIRVRQSIGRGLRLKDGKTKCTLWDISDDLRVGKYTNTTFKHLEERIKIYDKEQFDYDFKKLKLQ